MEEKFKGFSDDEVRIAEAAIDYLRGRKKELISLYAGENYPGSESPISMYMAGSPGAGKTEISKALQGLLDNEAILRLDPDDVRSFFPDYNGGNSRIFNSATSLAVERLVDHAFRKSKSFILDGTFSSLSVARKNIERSIKYERPSVVIYVHADPVEAWQFTQKRELKEGRNIPMMAFIEHYFGARETAQQIKDEYGDHVELWLVDRSYIENRTEVRLNVQRIDDFLIMKYSEGELKRLLP